jgi:hypothetical protein
MDDGGGQNQDDQPPPTTLHLPSKRPPYPQNQHEADQRNEHTNRFQGVSCPQRPQRIYRGPDSGKAEDRDNRRESRGLIQVWPFRSSRMEGADFSSSRKSWHTYSIQVAHQGEYRVAFPVSGYLDWLRRALMRARAETKNAPAEPTTARIAVGFSGDSVQPPCA